MRRSDENFDRSSWALVKEDHCKGHNEDREISIKDYRKEQGLEEYDEHGHAWRELVLKMKSAGPSIGKPSLASRQLFFMACYDLDRFREFVKSEGFQGTFKLSEDELKSLYEDDMALMKFSDRFIRQVMFGEESIDTHDDAMEKHIQRRKEAEALRKEAEAENPPEQ
jgi:hypothetical protein